MLKEKIEESINIPWNDQDREKMRSIVAEEYNWEKISHTILEIYKKL